MKRLLALTLILSLAAGCGESQEPAAITESAAPPVAAPVASANEPAAAEPVAANAATQSAAAAPAERIELAQADFSAVEAAGFVEGRHYRRLSPTQPTTTSADSVEVDEFFMYSCIHCYNLEPFVQAWLEDKPDFIEYVHIPTTWNAGVEMHARAYYTAEALGKLDEMHLAFFREMHEAQNFLQTPDAMAEFFGRFGVSREEFTSVFESFAVNTKVNRATELIRRYRIDSTPTIVVNGKYVTSVGMADPQAGNATRMFELIELLAAAELGR